jgi:hypothetical protein
MENIIAINSKKDFDKIDYTLLTEIIKDKIKVGVPKSEVLCAIRFPISLEGLEGTEDEERLNFPQWNISMYNEGNPKHWYHRDSKGEDFLDIALKNLKNVINDFKKENLAIRNHTEEDGSLTLGIELMFHPVGNPGDAIADTHTILVSNYFTSNAQRFTSEL